MAYYSGTGTKIRQGAAGLGRYFEGQAPPVHADGIFDSVGDFFDAGVGVPPPVAMAYKDGVFGAGGEGTPYNVGNDPGLLMAYKDGSLGACAACGVGATYEQAAAGIGYPLIVDGQPVDRPVTIYHGPVGATAIERGIPKFMTSERALPAYRGGLRFGPLMAYRDGSLGAAETDPHVVDLTDPATLKEVKTAVALFVPELTLTAAGASTGPDYFNEAFYEDPIWTAKADELWTAATQKLLQLPNYTRSADVLAKTKNGSVYPSVVGLADALLFGVASPAYGTDPQYFAKTFPILHAFLTTMTATADPSKFQVKEPYFTTSERVKGKGLLAGVSGTTLAAVGVVAAGLAYLAFRKKRR